MYDELVKRLKEHNGWALNKTLDEAADAIEELMRRCEQFQYMPPPAWIPVTERLPSKNDRYLTVSIEPWFGTTIVDSMRWSGVWMLDGRQTEATVTHWMPLPEPPKEELE